MRNKDFYDENQATTYLRHSIIRLDNEPIRVEAIQKGQLYYSPLGKFTPEPISERGLSLKDKRVNMNPVQLGFVNFSEWSDPVIAYKFFRTPSRQWKIGLCKSTVRTKPTLPRGILDKIMMSGTLADAIVDKYPSFEQALEKVLNKQALSIAFSREFAINKDKKILHLHHPYTRPVGEVYKDRDIQLNTQHMYLSEVLERAMA